MKRFGLIAAIALFPLASLAQSADVKRMIEFDADGDGVQDKIGVLADGCENDECPVELFTSTGSITLGYGKNVETGYVSPQDLGVNDPSTYPQDVPVVQIDGVLMAFDGTTAYPVADMISKDALAASAVLPEDLDWIKSRLHSDVSPENVYKFAGDLSPEGGDAVYSVFTGDMGQTSAWFLRDSAGAEVARGFSMDYPRIYQSGNDALRIVSVSQSGLGVMDVQFEKRKPIKKAPKVEKAPEVEKAPNVSF